jgi:hypothetical protein
VIIGAIAELAGLSVLHLDKDFELITGPPVERLQILIPVSPAVRTSRAETTSSEVMTS